MSRPALRFRFLARVMRVFFSWLYHPFAWSYDWVAALVSCGMWKEWVASVLPDLNGPRLLELGHGPGHLQAMLQKQEMQIFGIDESPQMGKLAASRLHKAGETHALSRAYAQNLPFPDRTFDQIVSTFPSEYIFDRDTLAEAYRVLVPGGNLVILPVAWITGQSWMERTAAWLFRVTGQSEDWTALMMVPFHQAGFQTEIKRNHQKRWTLLIILAHKG